MPALDETHDPTLRSWVVAANADDAPFPIQNLPYAAFRPLGSAAPFRLGVAIGDQLLDLSTAVAAHDRASDALKSACQASTLNPLMELGPAIWSDVRLSLSRLLREGSGWADRVALLPMASCEFALPMQVRNFTDFFAGIAHARNAGSFFRPDEPLLPNYKYVPIGYNGRSSSLGVSGSTVQRPSGQYPLREGVPPTYQPSRRLDYETELGIVIGMPSTLGQPLSVAKAEAHLFGVCLLNDWSARDIQSWEYGPLGPYLAKSFATTISPFVVTMDALAPFRTSAHVRPPGDPDPLPHLTDAADKASGAIAVTVETHLLSRDMRRQGMPPQRLSRVEAADALYWTPAQLVAHQTSNGCNLESGDLLGTGTVSGTDPGGLGSLLEISANGQVPLGLPSGESRTFLEDGDEVAMSAWCRAPGWTSIGFGACIATIAPSPDMASTR